MKKYLVILLIAIPGFLKSQVPSTNIHLLTHIIPEVGLIAPKGIVQCAAAAGHTEWNQITDFAGYQAGPIPSSITVKYASEGTITSSSTVIDKYYTLTISGMQSGDAITLTTSTAYGTDYDVSITMYYSLNNGSSWTTIRSECRHCSSSGEVDSLTGITYANRTQVRVRIKFDWGGAPGDGYEANATMTLTGGSFVSGTGTITRVSPYIWNNNQDGYFE